MRKKENWSSILDKELLQKANRPFKYGMHDCCLAISKIVYKLTGEDMFSIFEYYSTEEDVIRLKKTHGGILGIARYVAECFHLEEIRVAKASGGDVVVVPHSVTGEYHLGIVALSGVDVYCARAPRGWARLPLSSAITAFRIK